jgi:hypothetical protein
VKIALAAVLPALALLLFLTGTDRATMPQQGPEDPASARAVAALTGPDRTAAVLPPAFLAGHSVALVGGRLVDPGGSCSSPVALPHAFDDACRAHDLGYDLLRYAAAQGAPLGGWARAAIDRRFAGDLDAACEGPRCRLLAGVAEVVVDVNSWRQGWSVPVVEHGPFVRDVA